MKKTAGFLHVVMTIGVVLIVLMLVLVAIAEGLLFTTNDLTGLSQVGITFNNNGAAMTAQELSAFKPVLQFFVAFVFVLLLLNLLGALKIRKVLGECKTKTPFSDVSCKSLKGAARLEVILGIVGILGTIALYIIGFNVSLNGAQVTDTTLTLNLSFIFSAVAFYLLYHVAEYGRKLENKEKEAE